MFRSAHCTSPGYCTTIGTLNLITQPTSSLCVSTLFDEPERLLVDDCKDVPEEEAFDVCVDVELAEFELLEDPLLLALPLALFVLERLLLLDDVKDLLPLELDVADLLELTLEVEVVLPVLVIVPVVVPVVFTLAELFAIEAFLVSTSVYAI